MAIDPVARARTAYTLIEDKPSSIVFTKPRQANEDGTVTPETALPAQIVRINSDNRASVVGGSMGLNPTRLVVVYGVTAHPTAPANDLAEGYTFAHEGGTYRIEHVVPGTPGVIQAQAVMI